MDLSTRAIKDVKGYFRYKFRFDVQAGLTVAMISIPQSLAYAAIAGVNPIMGLYAAIVPAIIASLFGSSNHIVTGPTNTISLATSGVLIVFAGKDIYPETVFAVSFISGIIMLIIGLLGLGSLIRYVSNSVLTGFITGAAILIIINQLPAIMGLPNSGSHQSIVLLRTMMDRYTDFSPTIFGLGILSIAFLILIRKWRSNFPAAIILIVVLGGLVQIFNLETFGVALIRDWSNISELSLNLRIPLIDLEQGMIKPLLIGSGAVAMLSSVEAVSVAKIIGSKTGQRIDPSRECIGQGLASISSGLVQSIPTSGSLTRSAVNHGAGAVTRVAGGLSGVFVAIALLVFQDQIGLIPTVCLSAIIIVSAFHLIDLPHLKLTLKGNANSRLVFLVTFLAVILLPLQTAIYLGTFLSILIYLVESSHLRMSLLTLNGSGKFKENDYQEIISLKQEVAIVNIEGALYFAAVDDFEENINRLFNTNVRLIVIRLRRMRLLASTGLTAIDMLVNKAHENGIEIKFSGVSEKVMNSFEHCGIINDIGISNIFLATEIPYDSTRAAIVGEHAHLSD